MAAPFVVAPPDGARVRTRLMVDVADREVLEALGAHLGRLASLDLARRVKEGSLDAKAKVQSRKARKQALTAASSSRWAGAITRTTEDAYGLARRNLAVEKVSLQARIKKISQRVKVPAGEKKGKVCGYATPEQRWQKQRRLQVLSSRLVEVDEQLESGSLSICRGGKRLAKNRHNLQAAGRSEQQWRSEWESSRGFITADGEADKAWGNETIRWHPSEGWLEIKLPAALAHLANRPHGRWRLSCPLTWVHRADELAAQATSGALRYDISYDPSKARWYIDASWKTAATPIASLDQLRRGPVVAVDLNVAHLAVSVLDCYGNVLGSPITVPLVLDGLPASTRDGRIRAAISQILEIAELNRCGAVVIENLDFAAARSEGREMTGNRPSRGRRGKRFRRHISGLPTAKLRDRLTQMAYNAGVAVIAVDPAYTSKWGAEQWLSPLKAQFPGKPLTGHHAASVVIGRRGLGQRARRRGMCARSSPEDGQRATVHASAGWPEPAIAAGLAEPPPTRQSEPRTGRRQPPHGRTRHPESGGSKTTVPTGSEGRQVTQDRSGPPAGRCSLSRSV
ncbi:MAG: nuclease/transposase family protein [Mycobacteriales bacterium]